MKVQTAAPVDLLDILPIPIFYFLTSSKGTNFFLNVLVLDGLEPNWHPWSFIMFYICVFFFLGLCMALRLGMWIHDVDLIGFFFLTFAAAALLQSCLTLCDPIDSSQPGFLSLGFSRQEHWSGLPFPFLMHESEKWKWSCSVVSDSSDPMDYSLPGSSVHGIFQARVLEWGAVAFTVSHLYSGAIHNG